MKEITVPISSVHPWELNPREVLKEDYSRLKEQIESLGIYRRFLVCPDPQKKWHYIILGGNTRYHAIKEMGHTEVDATIVYPNTEARMLEYALSDNDQVGMTNQEKVAEIYEKYGKNTVNMRIFKIQTFKPKPMKECVAKFAPCPDLSEEERMEKIVKKVLIKCPECGFSFIP